VTNRPLDQVRAKHRTEASPDAQRLIKEKERRERIGRTIIPEISINGKTFDQTIDAGLSWVWVLLLILSYIGAAFSPVDSGLAVIPAVLHGAHIQLPLALMGAALVLQLVCSIVQWRNRHWAGPTQIFWYVLFALPDAAMTIRGYDDIIVPFLNSMVQLTTLAWALFILLAIGLVVAPEKGLFKD